MCTAEEQAQKNEFFTIQQPGRYIGCWVVGNSELRFASRKRPRWLTRLMCRWLLEWTWEEGWP